jgi:hypothetical protein
MHMAEKLNGKKNLLILLVIVLLGFFLLSLGNDDANEEDDMSATSTDAVAEEVAEEAPLEAMDADMDTAEGTVPETGDAEEEEVPAAAEESLGTGGPAIIGYDEEKWPIYGEAETTESNVATPGEAEVPAQSTLADATLTLIDNLGTVSEDTFEQIKPDLLELIAALEALIKDLEAYIAYQEAQQ